MHPLLMRLILVLAAVVMFALVFFTADGELASRIVIASLGPIAPLVLLVTGVATTGGDRW